MLRQLSLVAVLVCFSAVATAAELLIWVEGEQAVKRQLVDNAGLNDVNPDELSGGKWICSFSHEKEPTGTAEYAVKVPEAGGYHEGVNKDAGPQHLTDVDVDCRQWASHQGRTAGCQWHGHANAGGDRAGGWQGDGRLAR